jgi:hypothetical protein
MPSLAQGQGVRNATLKISLIAIDQARQHEYFQAAAQVFGF